MAAVVDTVVWAAIGGTIGGWGRFWGWLSLVAGCLAGGSDQESRWRKRLIFGALREISRFEKAW